MKKTVEKVKNKTVNYAKTNVLFFTFVIASVINSSLLRFLTVKNYFEISAILGDLVVVLVIGSFGYLLKPKNQFKYYLGWGIFFTVLCIINSMYYTNYLSFASASLLATSLQVVDVGDAVVQNVMEIKDFSYIWEIFDLIFVHISLKKRGYYDKVAKIEVLDHLDRSIEVKDNSFTMPTSPVMVKVTFEKDEKVPETGDSIITFIIISLICLLTSITAINKLRKNA